MGINSKIFLGSTNGNATCFGNDMKQHCDKKVNFALINVCPRVYWVQAQRDLYLTCATIGNSSIHCFYQVSEPLIWPIGY